MRCFRKKRARNLTMMTEEAFWPCNSVLLSVLLSTAKKGSRSHKGEQRKARWGASLNWLPTSLDSVGVRGFEPPTTCTPYKCATGLRHTPVCSLGDHYCPPRYTHFSRKMGGESSGLVKFFRARGACSIDSGSSQAIQSERIDKLTFQSIFSKR